MKKSNVFKIILVVFLLALAIKCVPAFYPEFSNQFSFADWLSGMVLKLFAFIDGLLMKLVNLIIDIFK